MPTIKKLKEIALFLVDHFLTRFTALLSMFGGLYFIGEGVLTYCNVSIYFWGNSPFPGDDIALGVLALVGGMLYTASLVSTNIYDPPEEEEEEEY